VVVPPGLLGEHRIERLGIEVEKIDLVSRGLQSVERFRPDAAWTLSGNG
jgi:hypothetical protein